jgi:Icc-related predicted phosphoesterase
MLKCIAISDTHMHSLKSLLEYRSADLLVHCGDLLGYGDMKEWYKVFEELKAVRDQFKHMIIVPGNHDRYLENCTYFCKEDLKGIDAHLLIDSGIEIEGKKIWGSPYTPTFGNWAFMKDDWELSSKWEHIPENLDLLICHGPAQGTLDFVPVGGNVGSFTLDYEVKKKKPKVFVFGHIHHSGGQMKKVGDTLYVNASICTEKYLPYNKVMEILL